MSSAVTWASEAKIASRIAWRAEVRRIPPEGSRSGASATRGVVTELDRRAENLIARSLERSFPEDGLLAEEGTRREGRSGWRWVVDPLDGTTNYVSGLPMFAVSLACLDGRGAVLGVVHAPALGTSFRAVRGA